MPLEGLAQEPVGRSQISPRTEPELDRGHRRDVTLSECSDRDARQR
jgi:hypothetical protein